MQTMQRKREFTSANTGLAVRNPRAAKPKRSPKGAHHSINFCCYAPLAKTVRLVGDFNDWDLASTPMHWRPDGCWVASLDITPGTQRYLFVVDGNPVLDLSGGRVEPTHCASVIQVS